MLYNSYYILSETREGSVSVYNAYSNINSSLSLSAPSGRPWAIQLAGDRGRVPGGGRLLIFLYFLCNIHNIRSYFLCNHTNQKKIEKTY